MENRALRRRPTGAGRPAADRPDAGHGASAPDARGMSPMPMSTCWLPAKPAPARRWSRASASAGAGAHRAISSRSIAARCRRRSSRASCSAMRPAPSPARRKSGSAASNMPAAARCFSTRSKACRCRRRSSCCGCWKCARSRRSAPMSVRPVDLRVVAAAKVDLGDPQQRGEFPRGPLSIGSTLSPFRSRLCASAATIFRCCSLTSLQRAASAFQASVPAVSGRRRSAILGSMTGRAMCGNCRILLNGCARAWRGGEHRPPRRSSSPTPCRCPSGWIATRPTSSARPFAAIDGDVRRDHRGAGHSAQDFLRQAAAARHRAQRFLQIDQACGTRSPI